MRGSNSNIRLPWRRGRRPRRNGKTVAGVGDGGGGEMLRAGGLNTLAGQFALADLNQLLGDVHSIVEPYAQ